MIKYLSRALFSTPIKPPPNPLGGMKSNISQKEMEKLMNPLGFLKEDEEAEV